MIKYAECRVKKGENIVFAHIYGGHRSNSYSTDAYSLQEVINSKPDAVVLDELAMKARNQDDLSRRIVDDVTILLDNGIDVYTTVNTLHFEAISNVCNSIGVSITKPLSQEWIERAKHVYFIKCKPEFLSDLYETGQIFDEVKKGDITNKIFDLNNLYFLQNESIQMLNKYKDITWLSRDYD